MEQLSLFTEPQSALTWYGLERDEQHALNILLLHREECYILHPLLQHVIPSLKAKGLVRDNIFAAGVLDVTPLTDQLFSDYCQYMINHGQMWVD